MTSKNLENFIESLSPYAKTQAKEWLAKASEEETQKLEEEAKFLFEEFNRFREVRWLLKP